MVYLDSSPVNLRFLAEGILDSKLMSDNYTLDIAGEFRLNNYIIQVAVMRPRYFLDRIFVTDLKY